MPAPLAALAAGAPGKVAAGVVGQVAKALQPQPSAEAKARKTAQDFETMFLEQTLDRLLASDGTEGPLGDNGTGGEVYRSMLAKEYAGGIARSGGVGIADQVYREILKMQESEHARGS
jgi:Rod binding domain-containing protein